VTLQSWLIYLTLAAAAAATPGPAILLITTNATLYGFKKTVYTALGNICALFCMGVITISGLGIVFSTSLFVFDLVRYLGAAYLVYLGLRLFFQKNKSSLKAGKQRIASDVSSFKLFIQAFGVAASNPKAIIFLTALFPQFVVVDEPLLFQFFLLITTLMTVSFSFLMLYSFLAGKVGGWLNISSNRTLMSRTSGIFFISIGLLMGISGRNG